MRGSFLFSLIFMYSLFGYTQSWVFKKKQNTGITGVSSFEPLYGHGASAADFDNDGDIDFYLCTFEGNTDRLYKNNGDGTFSDVASDVGLGLVTNSRTALWFDFNGDSRLDLLVLGDRCSNAKCTDPFLVTLYKQSADGTFLDVTEDSGITFGTRYDALDAHAIGGALAGDFNNDGYLDIVVSMWGGSFSVFQNNKNETFMDITLLSGMGASEKFRWQPMAHDFNGDGYLDIYCNVDYGKNEFWLNSGNSKFTDIASSIGVQTQFNEMGMALGDIENDGDLDIYCTNITRSFQGTLQHNVLFINNTVNGVLDFKEESVTRGVSQSGWDWGTTFLDANNDGLVDLVTTNGWFDTRWPADQSRLWLNGNNGFVDFSATCAFDDLLSATTLLAFDMDRDGDLDILQTLKVNANTDLPAVIYENHLESASIPANYITIKPRMNGPNRYAIGGVVRVKSGTLNLMRLISSGCSFYGQEPAEAFFGLGSKDKVDELRIDWPDGQSSVYSNIASNQELEINYEVVRKPSNFAGERTESGILLTWTDQSNNESHFMIQRSSSPTFNTFTNILVEANETSYLDNIQDPGVLYYRIRSFNSTVSSIYTTAVGIDIVTGINEENTLMKVYPNPSSGAFQIQLDDAYIGELNLRVMDIQGREIFFEKFFKAELHSTHKINLTLRPAMYILDVAYGSRQKRVKLVISK